MRNPLVRLYALPSQSLSAIPSPTSTQLTFSVILIKSGERNRNPNNLMTPSAIPLLELGSGSNLLTPSVRSVLPIPKNPTLVTAILQITLEPLELLIALNAHRSQIAGLLIQSNPLTIPTLSPTVTFRKSGLTNILQRLRTKPALGFDRELLTGQTSAFIRTELLFSASYA
jgi:hypothetical protein